MSATKIFVTGATGFVGEVVVRNLLAAGHKVLGLARSDASAALLSDLGAEVHRGDLTDPDSLAAGARASDGVIHTAFIHDFSNFAASVVTDLRAVETLVSALEGSGKPLVSTSGIALMPPGKLSIETEAALPEVFRAASERTVLESAGKGVRSGVVRLPPSVHGKGDHGFVPGLIEIARRKGFSAYPSEGEHRWAAVHRFDAANVYRLAVEKGIAGSRFHAVAEEGMPLKTIAEAIGKGLGIPVRSINAAEIPDHFEWLAHFIKLIDHPTSSIITRNTLGWEPNGQPGLLEDMWENYFTLQ